MAFRKKCKHLRYAGINGDMINLRNGARRYCLECGKTLPGLPPEGEWAWTDPAINSIWNELTNT